MLDDGNNTTMNVSVLICSNDFFIGEEDGCVPECGKWNAYPSQTTRVADGFIIFLCALGIMAAIVILILASVKPKRMWGYLY